MKSVIIQTVIIIAAILNQIQGMPIPHVDPIWLTIAAVVAGIIARGISQGKIDNLYWQLEDKKNELIKCKGEKI